MKRRLAVFAMLLCSQAAWGQMDPGDCQPLDVYVRSAKIYMGAGQKIPDFNSAQKQLDKGIECFPDAPEPKYLLSKIFYKKRFYDKLLELARALDTLDVEKKYVDTVWEMRRAAWGELFNRGVDSLKAYNRIDTLRAEAELNAETERFDSLNNLGRQYLESAKSLFVAALEMDASRSEPYQNLGVIDVRLQNWDEALVWYRRSLEAKPGDPDLIRNMMSLNLRMEQNDSAMHYVYELLALDPGNLEALTNKAGLYATLGFADSAHHVFEEIMAQDPNNKAVLFNLTMDWVRQAQAYAEQITRYSKQANEYTEEYNRLVQQGGSQKKRAELEQKRNDAITSLKEAQANNKETWGQAKSLSERLAALDSTDYEALYYWGMADFWLEDYAASLVPLERAVELKPDYYEAWQILYYAYARAGKGDMAARAKEAMENCSP